MGAGVYHSPYYLMPYRPGLPAVLTVYDFIPLVCPQSYRPAQRLIYRVAHGLALRSARWVLAISEATRQDLARFFRLDPARVTVTPLAVDARFAPQPAPVVQAARQRYGLPERYVLFLGSNKPHKNLSGLVQSWPSVVRRQPGARLVIAGHWDERFPEARRLSQELGLQDSVRFAGPIADADLPAVYSGAALFVFPSFYEGFGLPVLEAMACGAPVVCSNTSSLPEVAGDAALLVDPGDHAALAEAIGAVLADAHVAEAMRRRGVSQAARFTWEATALATEAAYSRVAGQPQLSTSHEAHA
jgi:alpha-1,3-rhamnosyl/mannosyltransferase